MKAMINQNKKLHDMRTDRMEYNRQEFIGDALYNFLVKDIVLTETTDERKRIVWEMLTNKFQASVAIKLGIIPRFGDPMQQWDTDIKRFANQLEVKIYQVFATGGYKTARQYFLKNILPNCESYCELIKTIIDVKHET